MKKGQGLCHLSEVEAMDNGFALKDRHDQARASRTNTAHIVSNQFWHKVAQNQMSLPQGSRLAFNDHWKFAHDLVAHIASKYQRDSIDLNQTHVRSNSEGECSHLAGVMSIEHF